MDDSQGKPIQLISIDKSGKCTLNKDTENLVSEIKDNVRIYLNVK